jgi:hypothetical protein
VRRRNRIAIGVTLTDRTREPSGRESRLFERWDTHVVEVTSPTATLEWAVSTRRLAPLAEQVGTADG